MHTFLVTIPYRAQYRIVATTPTEALDQALQRTTGADILERGDRDACTIRLIDEGAQEPMAQKSEAPRRPTTLKTALEDRDAEEQWADLARLERDLYGTDGPATSPSPPDPTVVFHEQLLNELNKMHTDLSDIARTLESLAIQFATWRARDRIVEDDEVLDDDNLTEAPA